MSQIFKNPVPMNFIFSFLDKICKKNTNKKFYIINNISFNLSKYHNYLTNFLTDLEEYYHNSKKYYINRNITYSRFITIIRQICKNNNISFVSFINYNKSTYNLVYHIYYNKEDLHDNNIHDENNKKNSI
tara:strand:+ start:1511 stop:1900 length:390 start_codon:yes stop_codon:yes gene_type:complete